MRPVPHHRIGAYELLDAIGAGGMGEVYRARDTRLGREVALKLLPAAFAEDAERLARFRREAQLLASLNHPAIATIHGFEETDTTPALVMELVPGPTLADCIRRGPLPLEEALSLARQIAEALEYAHERGIVHRDLKPANVKLTDAGAVKLLDFGLAKALADDPLGPAASHAPTLSELATGAGAVLGTAAYMAPEQARGKPADCRADVWSLGIVLFEMLSGRRPFAGETAAETLAAVLKTEPDWEALPSGTPPSVLRLLRRCLEKDVRRRLQAIGEARIAIDDVLSGVLAEPGDASPGATPAASGAVRSLPWLVALMAAAVALGLWAPWREPKPPEPPLRLSIDLGTDASLYFSPGPLLALSPDGRTLAFVAAKAGEGPRLYLRRLDQLTATSLAGTDNARHPFFSPDGQWIAFVSDGNLKKVATSGGAVVTVCDAADDRGGAWAADGTIYFAPSSALGSPLHRVAASGGMPQPLARPEPAAAPVTERWPQVLPGGRALLFTVSDRIGSHDDARLVLQPLPDGPRREIHRGGYHFRYVASGHIVYVHRETLFAMPFDLDRLAPAGPPAPVFEGVDANVFSAGANFAVSEAGTLAFLPGPDAGAGASIRWLDRQGKTRILREAPARVSTFRLAPDGRRLVMDISDGRQDDVWVYEWERDILTRLTFDASDEQSPIWSPDGSRVVYASRRPDGSQNLFWQPADGTGEARRLTSGEHPQAPFSWHPNGRALIVQELRADTNWDLVILPLEESQSGGLQAARPRILLGSPAREVQGALSPDGRWLAYVSNETGRDEVYVQPFPGPGGKWQISTSGGQFPTWSLARNELVFRAADRKLMLVPFTAEAASFRAETPREWAEVPILTRALRRNFDLHPDGQRAAVLMPAGEAEDQRDHLTLVFNFADELRRLAPRR